MRNKTTKLFLVFGILALTAHCVSTYLGLRDGLTSRDAMISYFEEGNTSNRQMCFSQHCDLQVDHVMKLISDKSDAVVFSSVVPTKLAEFSVILISLALASLAVRDRSNTRLERRHLTFGFAIGGVLFTLDQLRYLWTSVFDNDKSFFTSTSYCFQGDLGWSISAVGLFCMYAGLSLGIAKFTSIFLKLRNASAEMDGTCQGHEERTNTMCRIYTWLPYFSYIGVTVWIAGTGITGVANELYLFQALAVTSILVIVFAFCWRILHILSVNYTLKSLLKATPDSSQSPVVVNPMEPFLGPFDSKAFSSLIRIVLPLFAFLALYYNVFAVFLSLPN